MEILNKQMAFNYSTRREVIKYIVIHDTGNPSAGADANANFNYFNTGSRNSSADYFVDDNCAVRANDYRKYYSWHCGDGHGKYGITNANSVGIEICVNSDGNYNRAVANAAELVRSLMAELNIPADRVVRHYDASRKLCPASMSKNNWSAWYNFKKLITEEDLDMNLYNELKAENERQNEIINKMGLEIVTNAEENKRQNEIINLMGQEIAELRKKCGL